MVANIEMSRKHVKSIAKDANSECRVMDAVLILTTIMPLDSALREIAPMPTANVGDILVASWGYEQSNVDYYQVVAVTKSSVRIREIQAKRVGGVTGMDYLMPVPDAFVSVNPMRLNDQPHREDKGALHRIQRGWSGGYSVTLSSYSHATLWDGREGHATASGYGH